MALDKEILDRAAENYLATGDRSGLTLEELACACDRKIRFLTQVAVSDAVSLGKKFVARTRKQESYLQLTALRALGWAYLVAGQYTHARNTYLKARTLTVKDISGRARIDRVLIDVYMYLGNFKEARRRARIALTTFKKLKAPDEIAKTQVNFANLLHRQDRHLEAKKLYQEAAAFFEKQGDRLSAALCYYNQANTLVQLFAFREATSLYNRARKIFEQNNRQLHALGCLYGLSWLHMLEGNFHMALKELSQCEHEYRKNGFPRELVLCQLDRAEVYLGLNLYIDARDTAEEALSGARKLGIIYEAAKAAFFKGKALFGLGQIHEARRSYKEAEQGFTQINNRGFTAAVKLAQSLAGQSDENRRTVINDARRLFNKAQLPLWEAICDLQIITSWPEEKQVLKRLSRNPAVSTVPHLLAQHYTLLGDREARRRHMKPAVNYWTRAANVLDRVRAKLPPVELRSAFFTHLSDPYRKLIKAEYEQNPLQAAVWSERFKTAGLWSTSEDFFAAEPARHRVEASLSELAQQVTMVSSRLSEPAGKREQSISTATKTFDKLRQKVRDNLLLLEKTTDLCNDPQSALRRYFKTAAHDQVIIQFHAGYSDLLALVHYRGESRAFLYPDGIKTLEILTARWRFFVENAQTTTSKPRRADLDDEVKLLRQIGDWLLPPLELPAETKRLLILPEGRIAGLPWQALKNGHGVLADAFELVFAPSLRHHLNACQKTLKSSKIKIFIGASEGLPHLEDDINAVHIMLSGPETDIYNPCNRSDWPDKSVAKIWHFSGHALFRADNPFYSALLLNDGPLFAADFRLKQNQVGLVTLAACRTGQQTSLPGEEASGLVRSLLEMGARNVLASHWAVADQATSDWMNLFYKYYLGGISLGSAVQRAARGVREKYPSAYHWSTFSLFGAG
ncbi:MAG: CHAT domain-containing protein [candidate division Zixibacteria bacterium]|nr:CHAT domain-containing protein [candidate division Zixibacteria bacterium]